MSESIKKLHHQSILTMEIIENAMKDIARYVDDEEAKKLLKDNEGIGEESTRSNIIKLLKSREYIETKGKNLIATKKGIALIESVKGDIKSPIKTAVMERELKEVENGNVSVSDYVASQVTYTQKIVGDANQATFTGLPKKQIDGVKCPQCDSGVLTERKGQYGKFWSCSAYQSGCKASYPNLGNKPYIEPFKCDCGDSGELKLLSGQYGDYFKCTTCNKNIRCERNKPAFEKFVDGVKCPKCESKLNVKKSKAKKEYYPCSNRSCEFVAFKGKGGYSYNENDKWHTLKA